jgi:prepilin-type N-terminal cleavage/methylation domain-containing protein
MRTRRPAGFSLVELLAVLAIMAILAAVSLPRMASTAPYSARGYTDEIAGALRTARSAALAGGCDVQFTVTPAGYQVMQRGAGANNLCNPAAGFIVPVRRDDGSIVSGTPPSAANVAGNSTAVFGPAGGLTGPLPAAILVGPFRITVSSGGWVVVQ